MARILEAPGNPASLDEIAGPRARATGCLLAAGKLPFATLRECRSSEGSETLVVELEVELSQHQVHPIQRTEPLAIEFSRADDRPPEVVALREDFPVVPHLNLRQHELPRSLCLYDEPWDHVRRRWTPARFIEWLREWLRLTARGELHGTDQPLEPLFLAASGRLIIPYQLFTSGSGDDAEPLQVRRVGVTGGEFIAIVGSPAPGSEDASPRWVATTFQCEPQPHGLIRWQPRNLRDLHQFMEPTGSDLVGTLRSRLSAWVDSDPQLRDSNLILLVRFPKTREPACPVEASDLWAFCSADTVRSVGESLGLWTMQGGHLGRLIPVDASRDGADAKLELFRPTSSLSRELAANLNGEERSEAVKLTAIGAGALGSQVALNLLRSGFGRWTIIDPDVLLPHNLARHGLSGHFLGYAKAAAMEIVGNTLTEGESPVAAIVADVLRPGEHQEAVRESLDAAEVILDLSASVTVARHLALDVESGARRVSLFLNPSGTDLVLLAEDAQRSVRLDALELQFYRELITNPELAGHFGPPGDRLRYGLSCRDLTSRMRQDLVALHAAIGSRALRRALASEAAAISLWRADPESMEVRRFDLEPTLADRTTIGQWTVCIDEGLRSKLHALRERKLPNETGGVLIGSFDLERSIVYAVDMLPSPPDSEEWPTVYIRGCKGLKTRVEEIGRTTDGQLEYIGEWHSHPGGCTCKPSEDDLQVFSWLADLMEPDGLPAVMIIAGDEGELATFVGTIARHHDSR